MAFHSTLTGNVFFTKPTRIIITPFTVGSDGKAVKGADSYALDSIIADSTSITQDDADRNEIGCETRDENLYESITLGSYQFTCDNADWQDDLAKAVLGFTSSEDGTKLFAPSSYTETFAEIEIQFGDAATYTSETNRGTFRRSAVLPKVLLSSSATMESLKTSLGTMTVAGTAYSQEFTDGEKTVISPYYISTAPITKPV